MKEVTAILAGLALMVGGALQQCGANAVARTPPTTTTTQPVDPIVQYDWCRINGPGRTHAIADINAFTASWSQAQADALVADVDQFISICRGTYHTSNIVSSGKVLKACLLEWSGWLPQQGACYAPPGNETSNFHHWLLVSSA